MATELTDYEVQQIKRSLESYSQKKALLSKKIENDRFFSDLSRAKDQLSSYARKEELAYKSAHKEIERVFGSVGWLDSGRNNVNEILKNQGNDCSNEVEKIIQAFYSDVETIVSSLPHIGDFNTQYHAYEEKEYAGDTDISFNFEFASNSTSNASSTLDNDRFDESESFTVSEFEKPTINPIVTVDTYTTDSNISVLTIGSVQNASVRKFVCSEVKEIQANAFKSINGLEVIVIGSSIHTINVNAFRGVENKCIIAFKGSKETVVASLASVNCLVNRRVIFGYRDGDETAGKDELFVPSVKNESSKPKRIVIRENTPLDTNEIKEAFLSRNAKYNLTMSELDQGIVNAGNNANKDLILLETLKIKRHRDLQENSFWNYAESLQKVIKLSASLGNLEEELWAIMGLFYLDSSGYRMVNWKYNPYKQEPSAMYYHPKMQMNDLYLIQCEKHFSSEELSDFYKNSPYVNELLKKITDGYYSLENSIKMMLMAMEHSDIIYYPAQSGIKRNR